MSEISSRCSVDRLPYELWRHIFSYVYPPFHLRYTQTHDHLPASAWEEEYERASTYDLYGWPLMDKVPKISPLLVSRKFYDIGRDIFKGAFTGATHIVGRMIFKTVHHSYAGLMALTRTLAIADDVLWTFLSLNFKDKMPRLEHLIVLMKFNDVRSVKYEILEDTIQVKDMNYGDLLRRDVSDPVELFTRLSGMSSDPYASKHIWEAAGIRTTWRYICFAATQAVKVQSCPDLLVSPTYTVVLQSC